MKHTIFILLLLIFLRTDFYIFAQSQPIDEPAFLGGIDSLSKSFLREQFIDRDRNEKLGNETQGELIDDPRVVFSTYVGGNGYDCGNSLAVDSNGDVYIVGYTGSTNFPVSENALYKEKKGGHDMFIGKFTASGEMLWLTYFGGNGGDVATECIADKYDNLIVVGKTDSNDFPTTEGVEQEEHQSSIDVVLLKFAPDGELIWSRYFGGNSGEVGEGIALCANGEDFVITGSTLSKEYEPDDKIGIPVTEGVYQDSLAVVSNDFWLWYSDAFIAKFDKDAKLIWSTYFGGGQQESAHAIAVDQNDNIAIVGEHKTIVNPTQWDFPPYPVTPDAFKKDSCRGEDIFYAKFSPDGEQLLYSTFFCGDEGVENRWYWDDRAYDLKFDNNGNTVFCGVTISQLFPTTDGAYKTKYDSPDMALVKFSSNNELIWSTYFGGAVRNDVAYSLAMKNDNSFWIAGYSSSPDLELSDDAILDRVPGSTSAYNLIASFNADGFPTWVSLYSISFTYKVAIGKLNNVMFTGELMWTNKFPINEDAFQPNASESGPYDGFLVNLNLKLLNKVSQDSLSNEYIYPSLEDRIKNKPFPFSNSITSKLIYPNPADDILYYVADTTNENSEFRIYNLLGQELALIVADIKKDALTELDVSFLPTGIYYLDIRYVYERRTVLFQKN